MYRIVARPEKNRVTINFGNDYNFDQDEFEKNLKNAIGEVRTDSGAFDLLADFSGVPVMAQSRAAESQKVVAWCAANGLRKSANVVGSLIHKMQVRRLAEQDERFGYFEAVREAERWLDS